MVVTGRMERPKDRESNTIFCESGTYVRGIRSRTDGILCRCFRILVVIHSLSIIFILTSSRHEIKFKRRIIGRWDHDCLSWFSQTDTKIFQDSIASGSHDNPFTIQLFGESQQTLQIVAKRLAKVLASMRRLIVNGIGQKLLGSRKFRQGRNEHVFEHFIFSDT
jgi:hypothetical protein